jgi:hypothetical protein
MEGSGELDELDTEVIIGSLYKCNATCTNGKKTGVYQSCVKYSSQLKADATQACKDVYNVGLKKYNCKLQNGTCNLPGGGGTGDPHMFTFDGLRYEYQPIGEFVLATDNKTFTAHVRTEQYGGSRASIQTAVSVDIGADTKVSVYARENPRLRVNGAPAVIPCVGAQIPVNGSLCAGRIVFESGAAVQYNGSNQFKIYLADGSHLDVNVAATTGGDYLNTYFYAGGDVAPAIVGLYGNVNGNPADDLVTREGVTMTQPVNFNDMYGVFANSWRVTNTESLFDYAPGKTTLSFSNFAFPGAPMTTKDLPQADHDAALAACKAAGVPADQLEECALDAALMGHDKAQDFLAFGKF